MATIYTSPEQTPWNFPIPALTPCLPSPPQWVLPFCKRCFFLPKIWSGPKHSSLLIGWAKGTAQPCRAALSGHREPHWAWGTPMTDWGVQPWGPRAWLSSEIRSLVTLSYNPYGLSRRGLGSFAHHPQTSQGGLLAPTRSPDVGLDCAKPGLGAGGMSEGKRDQERWHPRTPIQCSGGEGKKRGGTVVPEGGLGVAWRSQSGREREQSHTDLSANLSSALR